MLVRVTALVAALGLSLGAWVTGEVADLLPMALLMLLGTIVAAVSRRWRRQTRPVSPRSPWLRPVAAVAAALLLVWGAALLEMRASVGDDRRYWAQARGAAGGLLYVALGDSAAQGIGAGAPDRGYVGLLADTLRRATGRPVQVLNLSRSGARIDDLIRDQLPRLQGLHPDLVTVSIGGNDIRAYDAPTFARQVDLLTAQLPPGTAIADVPYFMHGHWERNAGQAAAVVRQSAVRRRLTVVQLHAALQHQGWSAMLTQTAADWFHPNDRGYRVWAQAFWDAVRVPVMCQDADPMHRPAAGSCPATAGIGGTVPAP